MRARIEFPVGPAAGPTAGREVAAACGEAMGAAGIEPPALGPHEPAIATADVYRPLPGGSPERARPEPDA